MGNSKWAFYENQRRSWRLLCSNSVLYKQKKETRKTSKLFKIIQLLLAKEGLEHRSLEAYLNLSGASPKNCLGAQSLRLSLLFSPGGRNSEKTGVYVSQMMDNSSDTCNSSINGSTRSLANIWLMSVTSFLGNRSEQAILLSGFMLPLIILLPISKVAFCLEIGRQSCVLY